MKKKEEEQSGKSAYLLLEEEAERIKAGSEGLIALPYFMGERSPIWDPDARGTLIGLTLTHTKGHVYRAFMEGVAYSLRHNIEEAVKAGIKLDKTCYIVGGPSKSELWTQIFADVTGFTMKRLKEDAEAPLGNAFLAGLGTGVFKEPSEIKSWLDFRGETLPDKNNYQKYSRYFQLYKDIYIQTKDTMIELAKLQTETQKD